MSQTIPAPLAAASETYIDEPGAWARFVEETEAEGDFAACSIDTEADSMHSYETKLCLIQFARPGALAVIDPLALDGETLGEFTRFIDRFEVVWMHGADYDISLFNSTFGWTPRLIHDTQVAARLLGAEKFGLANLLEDQYGVKLSKQSQKADWSRRPLSPKMLEYAYNDVRFLIDLGDRYVSRLETLGRIDWFLESCGAARSAVLERVEKSEDDLWRVSGWGRLSPKGLHYLKHLWIWRDAECRRLDRPAFKFLGNQELLAMAERLEGDQAPSPPHYLRPGPVRRLLDALNDARDVDPRNYPIKHRRGDSPRLEIDEALFERMRRLRDEKASELGIDGTVIATRGALERLAAANLDPAEKAGLLLDWQRNLLAPALPL